MDEALSSYDILKEAEVSLIGDGLINETWKVKNCDAWFILQRINTTVFKNPQQIDSNLKLLAEYLSVYQTNYSFTAPVPNLEGKTMVCVTNQQYFRVFKFVPDSICYSTIDNPQLAHEAAKQFGLFTSMLAAFPVDQLSYTIPDFHNLPLRHQSFVNAVNLRQYPDRLELATKAIELVNKFEYLVDIYTSDVLGNDKFVKRVCHHDTIR